MSSSDRRVGRNESHHVPLQEVFDDWRRRGNSANQAEELPNGRIEVRINLNQSIVPAKLTNKLAKNNMDLSRSSSNEDIVIVFGIPPFNGFGEREVMEVVRKYAPYAQVVLEPPQRGGQGG